MIEKFVESRIPAGQIWDSEDKSDFLSSAESLIRGDDWERLPNSDQFDEITREFWNEITIYTEEAGADYGWIFIVTKERFESYIQQMRSLDIKYGGKCNI